MTRTEPNMDPQYPFTFLYFWNFHFNASPYFLLNNNCKGCRSGLPESLFFLTNTIHFISFSSINLLIDVMGWRMMCSGVRATECEEIVTEFVVNVTQHVTFWFPNNIFQLIYSSNLDTNNGSVKRIITFLFILLFR